MQVLFALLFSFVTLNSFAAVDPKHAYEMTQKGSAIIVDVREKEEIESGMVKDAVWFPKSRTETDKNWVEDFKKLAGNKQIFLYCRSGNRSGKVQAMLKKEGIKSENLGGFETLKHQLPIIMP